MTGVLAGDQEEMAEPAAGKQPRLLHGFTHREGLARDRILARKAAVGARFDAFVRDIPMSERHPTYQTLTQLEQDLPKLADLPSLLVWGMQDWCFRPECLHRFQAVWPNAKTVEIEDAGHYVIEDAPQETLEAIASFVFSRTRNDRADDGLTDD